MITKLHYDKDGNFTVSGLLKTDHVDFTAKKINTDKFFPVIIQLMIDIKKEVLKNLADDNRILSSERISVINTIDKFLTMILSLALTVSDAANNYSDKYKDFFEISIDINKTQFMSGMGKLIAVSSRDISDYDSWIDEKIIGSFKKLLALFNSRDNRDNIREELVKLIYNVISLRYKVEYI